jgi:branched-chain amino acid aminotransferase
MPTTIGILTPTGLINADYTAETLSEAARFEPDGVYTVTRTYRRDHALLLDAHLDRLEESAHLESILLRLDRAALRAALRTLIARAGYPASRFRITVPRARPDSITLTLEPFHSVSPETRAKGVAVATVHIARHNPRTKTTDWMEQREAARAAMPAAYEGILVNDAGELLEGFSSNFYAIRAGRLYTAGEGVLSGIARKVVLMVAPEVLPVELRPVRPDEIPALDEAFVTSSSRGVVPVIRIDEQQVGDGKPGPLTQAISARYHAWEEAHLEPI